MGSMLLSSAVDGAAGPGEAVGVSPGGARDADGQGPRDAAARLSRELLSDEDAGHGELGEVVLRKAQASRAVRN